jgi:hypothetical protein
VFKERKVRAKREEAIIYLFMFRNEWLVSIRKINYFYWKFSALNSSIFKKSDYSLMT